jgi:hypothetical protein
MKRLATLTAVLLSVLVLPGAALAAGDDPLLSGYGGPGSGDQAVLGGGVVGGGGSGGSGSSGSLRAATPSVPATAAPATAPSAATTPTTPTTGTSSGKHTKNAAPHRTHPSTPAARQHPSTESGTATKLPALATTPTRVDRSSAGAFPLSTGDLLLALVVALAVAALAVATSRLSGGPARPSDARG